LALNEYFKERGDRIIDYYLIRHAECEINLQDVVGGRTNNSPLTEKGIQQSKDLGKRLVALDLIPGNYGFSIESSPSVRTISTLLGAFEEPPYFVVNPKLQELSQGE